MANFSLWWYGPNWLSGPKQIWPQCRVADIHTEEGKRIASHVVVTDWPNDWQSLLLSRLLSWARFLRVTAYVLRAIKSFRYKVKFSKQLTATEIRDATFFWTRYVQTNTFAREIDCLTNNKTLLVNSLLKKLNPYVGDDGILRLGGRLRQAKLLTYQ